MGVFLDECFPCCKSISTVGILGLKDEGVGFNIIFDYLAQYLIAGAVLVVVDVSILASIMGIALRILCRCGHYVLK